MENQEIILKFLRSFLAERKFEFDLNEHTYTKALYISPADNGWKLLSFNGLERDLNNLFGILYKYIYLICSPEAIQKTLQF